MNTALKVYEALSNRIKFEFILKAAITALLSFIDIFPQSSGIRFTQLTAEDGLSLNRVTKIIQDGRGLIWIGTSNGLNMYDGYNFKIFMPVPSDSNSISSYAIQDICVDKNGNIWVGTTNGLNKYDWKTEKFRRYMHNPKDPHSLSNNHVLSIFRDDKRNIWVGTMDGLNCYNVKQDNFTVFKNVNNLMPDVGSHNVSAVAQDKNGNLWLGTWNGVSVIRPDGKILKQYFSRHANDKHFNYMAIRVIYTDHFGNMWIGTNGEGLKKYDIKTGKFHTYLSQTQNISSLSSDYITSIFQDNLNNLWIGTLNGLEKYNPRKNNFTRIVNDPRVSTSILSNQIFTVTQDNSGLIWVGTANGISRFFESSDKFHYYQHDPDLPQKSLTSSDVISVFIDKVGNIWAGTLNGLNEITGNGKKIIQFKNEPGNANSVSSNFVRTVLVDSKGMVWIGTNMHGLNEYNSATGRFKLFMNNLKDTCSISNNGITSICETRSGTLWFGTWWGLNRYDRKTGKFFRYMKGKDSSNCLQSNLIWDIFEDSKGMIWVGTDGGGLSELNPRTNKFTNFFNDTTNKNHISSDRVFTIFESKDGTMWFGTIHGLNRYDRKTGKIRIYTTADGLPGNLIDAVEEDKNDCLWIGTDKGLSRFNEKSGKFINYTTRNGIQKLEFVQNVAAKDTRGRIYFGDNGIMYFNPDSIKNRHLTSPVVFTDLKIYNKHVPVTKDGILKRSISDVKSIYVPPGNDMITLEFSLLDYYNAKRNTYRYKLVGFDKGWNNVGTRNTATYTNLPPGKYEFLVKATNNDGIGNEKEASLEINIIPAFYQTVWFKISLGMIIFLIIISVYEFRIRTVRKYSNMLEKKVDERTRDLDRTINELNTEIASKDKFFSIIAHDLRSPFIALLGFSNFMFDEAESLARKEIKNISGNILKSAKQTFGLLENLLNWARIKTGRIALEPENVNLKNTVEETAGLFKSVADNKDIKIEIDVPGDIFIFADLNMFQTVLRNLISNSVKFTNRNGYVRISAVEESEYVRISVADNGIGMDDEKIGKLFQIDQNVSSIGTNNEAGSGLGLILCKEFIELNRGKIFVESRLGGGTEFSFVLPKSEVLAE